MFEIAARFVLASIHREPAEPLVGATAAERHRRETAERHHRRVPPPGERAARRVTDAPGCGADGVVWLVGGALRS